MFVKDGSGLVHTLIVGTLAYVALVILLRIFGKRTLSKWNAFDFIVTIALGSSLATAILSQTVPLLQGLTAFLLLMVLQFIVTWLEVRSDAVQRLVTGNPALLLYKGEFRSETMRQERIPASEVRSALRSQGIGSVEEVAAVVLETDGSFSVVKSLDRETASALSDVEGFPKG